MVDLVRKTRRRECPIQRKGEEERRVGEVPASPSKVGRWDTAVKEPRTQSDVYRCAAEIGGYFRDHCSGSGHKFHYNYETICNVIKLNLGC